MAEPLTNKYGRDVPVTIANMIDASVRRFPRQVFLNKAIDNFESLGLMDRVRQIARALGTALPEDFPKAVDCILSSLGPELDATSDFGMQPFLYLPFTFFVADRGLDHFDVSMRAQYELTKRSTAEFSIRSFLVHDQARTLGCLRTWAEDSNPHVRRLVSEGTRPRLPWAPRLREFQKNPHPVVSLLELLKDDDVEYVRRSVANNLNDIGKDNPQTLIAVARKWSRGASRSRMRIVRHALRSALKSGDMRALAVLGFDGLDDLQISDIEISPTRPRRGGRVRVAVRVVNPTDRDRRVNVDLSVAFVRKSGRTRAKVFKMKSLTLHSGEGIELSKVVTLTDMTTRRHYPGRHEVSALVNGTAIRLGSFTLV